MLGRKGTKAKARQYLPGCTCGQCNAGQQSSNRRDIDPHTIRRQRGEACPIGPSCPVSVVMVCPPGLRSEEHTSELQSLMRISYAVFCLKKTTRNKAIITRNADNGTTQEYRTTALIMTKTAKTT